MSFHSMFIVTFPPENPTGTSSGASRQPAALQGIKGSYKSSATVAENPVLNVEQQFLQLLGELGVKHTAHSCALRKANGDEIVQWWFICETGETEFFMSKLEDIGIGKTVGSINVLPVDLTRQAALSPEMLSASVSPEGAAAGAAGQGTWMNSIPVVAIAKQIQASKKNRVVLENIVQSVRGASEPTFDFFIMICVATGLCTGGLCNNSIVGLFSSMLASPLMGPILGMTFGTAVKDKQLAQRGLRTEIMGGALTILLAILFSIFWAPIQAKNWPRSCYDIRPGEFGLICAFGTWQIVVHGIAFAICSGVGIAISMLTRNQIAMVGVGISAALLPPAVGCGTLLGYAIAGPTFRPEVDVTSIFDSALTSFLLYIENIAIIYIFGILVFKWKEVTPIPKAGDFIGMIL